MDADDFGLPSPCHQDERGWLARQTHWHSCLFYFWLEKHDFIHLSYGKQAIIHYAAQIRQRWHDSLRHPDPVVNPPFNLAIIRQEFLREILAEVKGEAEALQEGMCYLPESMSGI